MLQGLDGSITIRSWLQPAVSEIESSETLALCRKEMSEEEEVNHPFGVKFYPTNIFFHLGFDVIIDKIFHLHTFVIAQWDPLV